MLQYKYRNRSNKRPGAYLIFLLLRGALIRDGRLFERGAYKIFLEQFLQLREKLEEKKKIPNIDIVEGELEKYPDKKNEVFPSLRARY